MAAPFGTTNDFGDTITANKFEWNAGVRAIDMHPSLVHLSPLATVTFNLFNETELDSASPEWLQRTLDSVDSNNAVAEAADYTFTDPNVPTRIQQIVRLMRKTAQVSGRAMADKVFPAVATLKQDQTETRLLELRRDMNNALINSQLVNVDEVTASRFRGILQSIAISNTSGSIGVLTEADIKGTMLKGVYDDGWMPDTIVIPPNLQTQLDTFTTSNTQFIDAEQKTLINHLNVYDTPFGRVNVVMERGLYLADNSVPTGQGPGDAAGVMFAVQRDMWQIAYYRRTWMEEPPRDGDRWRGVIQVEWALKDLANTAGYSLTGVSVS